jgi:hypothetical protein
VQSGRASCFSFVWTVFHAGEAGRILRPGRTGVTQKTVKAEARKNGQISPEFLLDRARKTRHIPRRTPWT